MNRSLALLLGCALWSTSAAAQDDDARKMFKEAQEHFDGARYDQALELARKAFQATGSPNARLYVARALRGLGRFDEAYEEMSLTLDDATEKAKGEDKYVATRDAAAAELALLKQKVGRVIVAVVDAPTDLAVSLNGKPLEAARVGQPVAVLPGDSLVSVEASGFKRYERTIQVTAGNTMTVAVRLLEESADAPPSVPPPKREAAASSGGISKTWGYVGLGVGAAGLAAFTIFGLSAKSTHDKLDEECGGPCTDPKYQDDIDSGKRSQTFANIGLGIGAIGVAAGVGILLFGGPSKEAPTTAVVDWNHGPALQVTRRF